MSAVPSRRRTGRDQLLAVALRLFARDGIQATSLQDIADEAGVTKAGLYYHYKTKDEIVLDVLRPLLDALPAVTRRAEAHRTRTARVDEVLGGLIEIALYEHSGFAVLMQDPYLTRLLGQQESMRQWWDGTSTLILGPDPDPQTRIGLAMFINGLAGAGRDPAMTPLDDRSRRQALLECGRRLLRCD
ncbi:TetR/AcrR family transcriptional regulator [Catellatospora bangladeshensis]|uniref:TetR family transcriptional regulator n=1 Tax=Catellatospora bangladeshensis TaxID=310355 RepID=A0A8J3JQZ8_9ACTN|nr:TetR family transcriptional regulator [Catellatospora bangladeshensis]GIF83505.1 TetR family transcriptional regulator [Catellatospora bangladeshensis]